MGGITTITINKVKYIGIASLTIAILSVLTLNIISSYSSSNTNSNAEPATQANGPLVSGPATISLSITSSSSTGGNDANLSLSIPQGGGIATGRHTVEVSSNSYAGYNVLLSASESNNDETSLVNTTNGSSGGSNSYSIPTTTGNLSAPSKLDDNAWGYTLTNPAGQETNAIWAGLQPSTNKTAIATTNSLSNQTDSYPVYYGVRVDNPSQLLAGDYQTQVVYTATVELPSRPTITSVSPNTYKLGSGEPNTITISATSGLASTYNVWIDLNDNDSYDTNEQCTNLNVASDTTLTCNIPTDESITTDTSYTVYVQTQASIPAPITNAFTYTKQTGSTTINSGTVSVDIDDSMIPVVYTGTTSTSGGKWTSVSIADIKADPTKWFDYTGASTNGDGPHWANAVTVENPENYRESGIDIPQDQIKGYWVYIPRYAYRVQRRDASNSTVSAQDFDIVFETKDDPVKRPVKCQTIDGGYETCIMIAYGESGLTYPNTTSKDDPLNSQTAWATHPAFTWGTEELNGFWIGKFETTGTANSPTVLPNQYHLYQGNIGDYYDVSQSIGVEDKDNVYGNSTQTSYNNGKGYHNLAISTSHMLKNSEWGAVAYLSASKYGAGVNNVQLNNSYGNGGTGKGPSGGAYNTTDGQSASTTNNIYGVYDMAGGAWEHVMGGYTDNPSQSMSNDYLKVAVKPPYVDLYVNALYVDSPFNGNYITNNDLCTWSTCGGHALHETKTVKPVSGYNQSWGGNYSYFVYPSYPWFGRGGEAYSDSVSGIFASNYGDGRVGRNYGFRVALLVIPTK